MDDFVVIVLNFACAMLDSGQSEFLLRSWCAHDKGIHDSAAFPLGIISLPLLKFQPLEPGVKEASALRTTPEFSFSFSWP